MKRQRMHETDVCLVGFRKTAAKEKEDEHTGVDSAVFMLACLDESQQFYEKHEHHSFAISSSC